VERIKWINMPLVIIKRSKGVVCCKGLRAHLGGNCLEGRRWVMREMNWQMVDTKVVES
jgi:hypothetical protein